MGVLKRFNIKRQKSGEFIFRFTRPNVFKKVFKIVEGVDCIGIGSCNKALEKRAGMSATRTSCYQPVFSSQSKGSDLIFGAIIIDLERTIG